MDDSKNLVGFACFSVLIGVSFGTTFFSLAFLYSSIESQSQVHAGALVGSVLGMIGLFMGITQLNKVRSLS